MRVQDKRCSRCGRRRSQRSRLLQPPAGPGADTPGARPVARGNSSAASPADHHAPACLLRKLSSRLRGIIIRPAGASLMSWTCRDVPVSQARRAMIMSVRTKHLSGTVIRERSSAGTGPALWSPAGADGDRQYLWPGRGAGALPHRRRRDRAGHAPGSQRPLQRAEAGPRRPGPPPGRTGCSCHRHPPRRAAGTSRGPAALRGQSLTRPAGCQPAIRQSAKPAATCLTADHLTDFPPPRAAAAWNPDTRPQPASNYGKPPAPDAGPRPDHAAQEPHDR